MCDIFVIFSVGSVLLQDEAHSAKGDFSTDVSISMDSPNHHRYQQQLQLIDEQVNFLAHLADYQSTKLAHEP